MARLADLLVRIGVDAEQVDQDLGKVDGFFEKHGAKFEAAGAALGATAGAAIATGLTAGMEKEVAVDKLAANLGATGAEASKLGKIAGNLYAQGLGEGMGDVTEAVDAVMSSIKGMRNAGAPAIEDLTAKMLNLAKGTGVDVAEAALSAGTMIQSGLAKDGVQAVDMLTASMKGMAPVLREELLGHMDEYSRHLARFGITGDRAVSFIRKAAEKGKFSFDKWMDAIGEVEKRILGADTNTADAFKALGLNFDQIRNKVGKGGAAGQEAISQLAAALSKVKNPAERSGLAFKIFGTQAEDIAKMGLPAFLSELQKTDGQLDKSAGAAENYGKTLNDNAATGIESWRRKTEQALASMVNAEGVMGDTAQAVAGISQVVSPIGADLGGMALAAVVGAKAVGGMAKGVAKGAVAIASGAKTSVLWLGRQGKAAALASARGVRAGAVMVASAAKSAAATTVSAARVVAGWVLMGIQSLLAAAKVAAAWLISMGPIAIVIAAVVGLVVLIVKNWDKIKAIVATGWNWVRQKTSELWTWAVNFIKQHWLLILAVVTGPIGLLVGLIVKNWEKIKSFTSSALSAVVRFFVNGFVRANAAVARGVQTVVGWVKGLPGRILRAIGNLNMLLASAGRNVIQGLIDGMGAMLGKVRDKIASITQTIRDHLPFSPAKMGPLSGPGSPDLAGRKISRMIAAGMKAESGRVTKAASSVAGASKKGFAKASGSPIGNLVPGIGKKKGFGDGLISATMDKPITTPRGAGRVEAQRFVLELRTSGTKLDELLLQILRHAIKVRGGNPQIVLGGKKQSRSVFARAVG
ncbi:hypothetical protein [Actinocorallia longicatena]|uniref:Phage tail tape measure protein domain-containing protein n=1 Tax=Actinocorallia longicatena TaxID=111803 RepID=A0ABP6QK55_9ACTN